MAVIRSREARAIVLAGETVAFTLTRSKRRRNFGISVHPRRGVSFYSPWHAPLAKVHEIMRKKESWILQCLRAQAQIKHRAPPRHFIDGEQFSYLGELLTLEVRQSAAKRTRCKRHGQILEVSIFAGHQEEDARHMIKEALIKWYRLHALEVFVERVTHYSELLQLFPKQILIRDQKTLWGSCSAQGVIRFNWRVIMAPIAIVDYLVVHELCHLKVRNHPPKFWKLVATALPDYAERRAWLRKHGSTLSF